ncbi:cyclase [Streptomyces sp. Ru73]|uniref:SRPBCC family protein n=1 Tax=Streptomyces sp. Ru73 TaxID=2080748 RepID=UPI000CDD0269|nr:SRPBCC family protein [Streptomyces sp. Ru73]POX39332.1 cyclase [Streptomyces sp. Ru73]
MADGKRGGTATLKETLARSPATDRLKEEAAAFAAAQAQRLLIAGGRRLGAATTRLQDMAEGEGPGLGRTVLDGGRRLASGEGPLRAALGAGASGAKDRLRETLRKAGGGQRTGTGQGAFVTIVEDTDVGVPVRTAYDQWTQFQEFGSFAKGVQNVDRTDDTTSDWRAKVFWSTRSWQATVTEQVPDRRIAWTARGAKASLKGVVTFHELAPELTRVLLVIEYYPKGLFERTGNLWRAQGRRARLDLKHFRRFVMLRGEATDGWRGEVRDGEVVASHEDAVAREDDEDPATAADGREEPADGPEEPAAEDERDAPDEAYDDEDVPAEDVPEEELAEEDPGDDEYADEEPEAYEDEDAEAAEDAEEDAEADDGLADEDVPDDEAEADDVEAGEYADEPAPEPERVR